MSHLLKIFDHTKDERSHRGSNASAQSAKKTKHRNGIYRTIRVAKSNSEQADSRTPSPSAMDLKIYDSKPNTKAKDIVDSFNTLQMKYANDDFNKADLLARKNSDIVFYKERFHRIQTWMMR